MMAADSPILQLSNSPTLQLLAVRDASLSEAIRIVRAHDVSQPLYMYLAYEAVHSASGHTPPLQAPYDAVERFASKYGHGHVEREIEECEGGKRVFLEWIY